MDKNNGAKESKLSPKLTAGIIIALFFGIALYIRIYLPLDQVFGSEWIKFTSADAYRHIRLIDSLVYNFPHLISLDPYLIYPRAVGGVGAIHFFEWLLASIIWIIGLGSPTQHTIDVVSVYFPAILGALCVIPVYFIGKELFHRWAGVIAAGLIALLPGEFLGRSILGFTDHPVAEVLFTTVTILFLILAIKASRKNGLTFNHIKRRDWATITKPVIYSLLAGVFLGTYLLGWAGALLFVFIISIYLIIQSIIDHLRHQSPEPLCVVGVILFFVALLIFLPAYQQKDIYLPSMVIALLIPVGLTAISRLLTARKIKPAYYPLTLVGVGLIGLGILYLISPLTGTPLLSTMLGQISAFFAPKGAYLTVLEMQPFLFPGGVFSLKVAWANFTTSSFLSIIALVTLIYLAIKRGNAEWNLLVIWSLVILAATLGQRRFAYYFAINVALLTSYLSLVAYYAVRFAVDYFRGANTSYMSSQALELADFKKLTTQPVEPPTRVKGRKTKPEEKQEGYSPSATRLSISLWAIVIFFLVLFPNIRPAITVASQARFAPSDAWCQSLSWMKENTPDPFGDPNYYYQLYQLPAGERYEYPESAYGVTAWWDYGFWITRIAHRLPNANPGQVGATKVAHFFLSQDEDSANDIAQELDSAYTIIDYSTVTIKFWAIAAWADREEAEFEELYRLPQENKLVALFYPEYYRSLAARLYNFDGKAVTPEETTVISYQEKTPKQGKPYKLLTSAKTFSSYKEAVAYMAQQESGNYRIVGINPFISPVPLTALEHYQTIYSSDSSINQTGVGELPLVKIFEHIK